MGALVLPGATALESASWYSGEGATTVASSTGNGNLRLTKFVLPVAKTFNLMTAEVTTLGSSDARVRYGVYADNGTGVKPALAAALVDTGDISGLNTTGFKDSGAISLSLNPGVYWLAFLQHSAGTPPEWRCFGNYRQMWNPSRVNSATGWLQASAGTSLGTLTSISTSGTTPIVCIQTT